MNTKTPISKEYRWVLLDSSGELSSFNQWRLRRALAGDERLRNYAATLRTVSQAQQTAPLDVPSFHTGQIEYLARRQREVKSGRDFFTIWQPALAYSAVAIALGMTIVYMSKNWEAGPTLAHQSVEDSALFAWEDPYLDDLNELAWSLAQFDEDQSTSVDSRPAFSDEIDQLAWELLTLEESS